MRLPQALNAGLMLAAGCLFAQAQTAQAQTPPATEAPSEIRGIPPRAAPADYLAHAQAGTVTIAADFTGHSVPVLPSPLRTEDHITVEVALFGAPGSRLKISATDFSLRINGRKAPYPNQPFGAVLGGLKDPEWVPPEPPEGKEGKGSKTSINGSGKDPGAPPVEVKVPLELRRAMAQKVQKAALPEGDRALPQAGLIFFEFRGKEKGIRSVELIYEGPAGKATLPLQ